MRHVLLLAAGVAALMILKESRALLSDPEDQTGSIIDQIPNFDDISNMITDTTPSAEQAAVNRAAMLAAVRYAEGTQGGEGYRALFGWRPGNGRVFSSYVTHPRQFFNYTDLAGRTIRTSAAGAYQITATTFDALQRKYPGDFSDFSPASQDAMALTLIQERGALADIDAGRLDAAIKKIRPIWASLPGAGADQPERGYGDVAAAFVQAGGVIV
jgi:lysozyme